MADSEPITFGPYLLGTVISSRKHIELSVATLFAADGTQHTVALRRTRSYDDGASDAFLRRAERYAMIRHPNVAEVKDLGALEGRSYIATEYVRGYNLLKVLARCGQKRLGFPTDVALFIVQRVLDALAHAHGLSTPRGEPLAVVHGDVSHSNILISPEGHVRLSDFDMGPASTRRRTPNGLNVGVGRGYSSYFSPEQARGEPADERSDLFSVGVILYELVTGHILFNAEEESGLLEQIAGGRYAIPLDRYRPDLHPMLAWIIRTALAPEPAERFASAASFSASIDELLGRVNARLERQFLHSLMQRLFGSRTLEAA